MDIRHDPDLKMEELWTERDDNHYWIRKRNGALVDATIYAGPGWTVEKTASGFLLKPKEEVELVRLVVKKKSGNMEEKGQFDGQGKKMKRGQ